MRMMDLTCHSDSVRPVSRQTSPYRPLPSQLGRSAPPPPAATPGGTPLYRKPINRSLTPPVAGSLVIAAALTFSRVLLKARPTREADAGQGPTGPAAAPDAGGLDPASVPRRAKQFVAFLLQEDDETAD